MHGLYTQRSDNHRKERVTPDGEPYPNRRKSRMASAAPVCGRFDERFEPCARSLTASPEIERAGGAGQTVDPRAMVGCEVAVGDS